jgi:uncharacterized short protein YbdD (DUF466 family)
MKLMGLILELAVGDCKRSADQQMIGITSYSDFIEGKDETSPTAALLLRIAFPGYPRKKKADGTRDIAILSPDK